MTKTEPCGWRFTLSVGSPSSAGLKQHASIVEHPHAVLPSAWCAVFVQLSYSVPDLKQTANKPVVHVWLSVSSYIRKKSNGCDFNRTIKRTGNKSTRKYLFLCGSLPLVYCMKPFVDCRQPHCGFWRSSDFQLKHLQILQGQMRIEFFHPELKEEGEHVRVSSTTFSVWWVRKELISHRAYAGIFDIHPKRVWHHFVVTCMVVRYNAEWWHHFFGNGDSHWHECPALWLQSEMVHQAIFFYDLGRQTDTSSLGKCKNV